MFMEAGVLYELDSPAELWRQTDIELYESNEDWSDNLDDVPWNVTVSYWYCCSFQTHVLFTFIMLFKQNAHLDSIKHKVMNC